MGFLFMSSYVIGDDPAIDAVGNSRTPNTRAVGLHLPCKELDEASTTSEELLPDGSLNL